MGSYDDTSKGKSKTTKSKVIPVTKKRLGESHMTVMRMIQVKEKVNQKRVNWFQ